MVPVTGGELDRFTRVFGDRQPKQLSGVDDGTVDIGAMIMERRTGSVQTAGARCFAPRLGTSVASSVRAARSPARVVTAAT